MELVDKDGFDVAIFLPKSIQGFRKWDIPLVLLT